jgi:hypothetical protein
MTDIFLFPNDDTEWLFAVGGAVKMKWATNEKLKLIFMDIIVS